MFESKTPLDTPRDEEGLAIAAFLSGRWEATRSTYLDGHWSAATDGRSLPQIPHEYDERVADLPTTWHPDVDGAPEPVRMAGRLNRLDWLDADGQVTELGRRAYSRWLAIRGGNPAGRWERGQFGWHIKNEGTDFDDIAIDREQAGWRIQCCSIGADMENFSDWDWHGGGALLTDADIIALADHIRPRESSSE